MRRLPVLLLAAILAGLAGLALPASIARAASPVGVEDIVAGSVDRSSYRLEATYGATLRLTWGSGRVRVRSVATIRNTSGAGIDRVELNAVPAKIGGMTLGTVTVDGVRVAASVRGQTIVVPLGGVLPVGGTTRVRVEYDARLRSTTGGTSWLFSKANGIANLYRWLPWVSRRTPFQRQNHGDPFVTQTSPLVRVRIVSDRPLEYATTGRRIARDGLSQTFEARHVRDFTVTASTNFETRTTTVGGTKVIGYARSGALADRFRDEGVRALRRLEALLGNYPHPEYKVVQSAGGFGMESPALTWIPTGYPGSGLRLLVTHETAHQWFYGIVGNDQAREPFVDEAATDFTARYVLGAKRGSRCDRGRLDLAIYDYSNACYYEIVYIQGGNLIDRARREIGTTAFWKAIRSYLATNRGRVVSTRTFLDALDAATSTNLSRIFAPRFPSRY